MREDSMSDEKNIGQAEALRLAMRASQNDPIWEIRGKAIEQYAQLEQALFLMFCGLSGMDVKTGGTIFFRIVNTRARNTVIENLFRNKFSEQMKLFRNSLIRDIGILDKDRNSIVHWHMISPIDVGSDGGLTVRMQLEPPTYWERDENTPCYSSNDIIVFIDKCKFYARVITTFVMINLPASTIAHNMSEEIMRPWRDIFQQAIAYPPRVDHPIFLMPQTS
jgi:hypothetical protein